MLHRTVEWLNLSKHSNDCKVTFAVIDTTSKKAGYTGLFWFWVFAGVFYRRAYVILVASLVIKAE